MLTGSNTDAKADMLWLIRSQCAEFRFQMDSLVYICMYS
jgi:hypothetical protein